MTRVVTLTYHTADGVDHANFSDDMGQWVSYTIDEDGNTELSSFLHSDSSPVSMVRNSVHASDIEAQALYLLGIPMDR